MSLSMNFVERQWLQIKDKFLSRLGWRTLVCRKQCDHIIACFGSDPLWDRVRCSDHAGAVRNITTDDFSPAGPNTATPACSWCPPQHHNLASGCFRVYDGLELMEVDSDSEDDAQDILPLSQVDTEACIDSGVESDSDISLFG